MMLFVEEMQLLVSVLEITEIGKGVARRVFLLLAGAGREMIAH